MRHAALIGCLLLLLSSLAGLPASAQQTWTPQTRTYLNGELSQLPDGTGIVHQLIPLPDEQTAMLRHVALDSLLHQRHQASLILRGYDLHLASRAINQRAALYRFRRKANDTAFTAVIDTTGKVLSFRREHLSQFLLDVITVLPTPSDSLLLLFHQPGNEKSVELECLDVQQRSRWKLPLAATNGRLKLLSYWADAQYIWLVTGDNASSRLTEHTAWCLELRTGRIASRTLLDQQGTRRFVVQTLLQPDHSLILAGRTYYSDDSPRISRSASGNVFLTQLQPDGTRQLDHVASMQQLQGAKVLTTDQIYWQQLGTDAQGHFFLLGETFTSTSTANQLAQEAATRLLTLGRVGVAVSAIEPRDLVRLQFDAQGQLAATTLIPLPPGQRLNDAGATPAQNLAAYAASKGIFRLRAVSSDGRLALLRNRQDFSLLNLDTQQLQPLPQSRAAADTEVWGIRHNRALLYHAPARKFPRSSLEWVPLR